MSRSQNRADTAKWKQKRKDHDGDKCNLAKCGICSAYKRIGNSAKLDNKSKLLTRNTIIEEDDEMMARVQEQYPEWEELNELQIEILEKLRVKNEL